MQYTSETNTITFKRGIFKDAKRVGFLQCGWLWMREEEEKEENGMKLVFILVWVRALREQRDHSLQHQRNESNPFCSCCLEKKILCHSVPTTSQKKRFSSHLLGSGQRERFGFFWRKKGGRGRGKKGPIPGVSGDMQQENNGRYAQRDSDSGAPFSIPLSVSLVTFLTLNGQWVTWPDPFVWW